MNQLTATDLKVHGVAANESILAAEPDALISVRANKRYVVMDIARYNHRPVCGLAGVKPMTHAGA